MALREKLALVTGGASGIGEAVCHALAEVGATVVVADCQLEAAKKVAQALPGDAQHLAEYVDVGDSSSVHKLFATVRSASSLPLNIVVNSAGIHRAAPIIDCPDDIFDDIIRINLKGTFLVTRAAGQEILRSGENLSQGGAAIVNIASIAGKSGWAGNGAYAASKAGVVALTKTAALELAEHGIRCNAVLPGWTETPMTHVLNGKQKTKLISSTALMRSAQPREIAEAVKFLCLPTASAFVTGAAVDVSGGLYM